MRRISAIIAAVAASILFSSGVTFAAQEYPLRPIRVLVPFPPGGGADIIGRIVALKLGEALGQPLVVDNRSGAGGTIATDIAAKAPADGYTILVSNISLAVNATLYRNLPYDTLRDLAPVTTIGQQPNILVVHPSVPANSLRELLALIKARPGQINYGSGGFGTSTYLATELLKLMTRLEMVHVPYKGLGPALTGLLGGQVQLIISTLAPALPQVKAGRLRALAVTTAKRSAFVAEIPTMSEAGVTGYDFSTWYGLWLPAGTPKNIVVRLNRETEKLLNSADALEQFNAQGVEPLHLPSEQFAAYVRSEVEKWGKVIRATGARPE